MIERADGTRVCYPSISMLHDIAIELGFVFRIEGRTSDADGVNRFVLHFRLLSRPIIFLNGISGSGKSQIAEGISRYDSLYVLSIDALIRESTMHVGCDQNLASENLPLFFELNKNNFLNYFFSFLIEKIHSRLKLLSDNQLGKV